MHAGVFRENCADVGCVFPTVGSLCKQKDPECDKETSECTDFDGVALCQCKSGYFKYNKMDHSCRGIALRAAFSFLFFFFGLSLLNLFVSVAVIVCLWAAHITVCARSLIL